jgi:hypothetical protein
VEGASAEHGQEGESEGEEGESEWLHLEEMTRERAERQTRLRVRLLRRAEAPPGLTASATFRFVAELLGAALSNEQAVLGADGGSPDWQSAKEGLAAARQEVAMVDGSMAVIASLEGEDACAAELLLGQRSHLLQLR